MIILVIYHKFDTNVMKELEAHCDVRYLFFNPWNEMIINFIQVKDRFVKFFYPITSKLAHLGRCFFKDHHVFFQNLKQLNTVEIRSTYV